jgi:hypothetical protein
MSATATSMYDFIETFAIRVPYNDIHPLSQQLVHNDISAMREMAHHGDDPAHILKLMHSIASLAIYAGPQMIALRHITSRKPTSCGGAPTRSRSNNDPDDETNTQ